MAVPTFTPPYAPTDSTDKPEVKLLKAEFGDGYTQTAGDGMNHIRKVVDLSWEVLTPAQAKEIEAFFVARGGFEPFYYTLSDDDTPILWTCEEWSRKRGTPNTMEATLRQCFTLV
ncbi:phage tail protein [Methylobacterium oryzae]|uniref:phage tail protein n=1 Tax=Methylobacterium oryzae TaxID=334852 RepID=UPI001F2438AF|nr:phage tail protein [Methylobacterium oryzae]UIN38288.1 phage tail protein [Methylobacterium oryzae]